MKKFYKGDIFCHLFTDLAYVFVFAIAFLDMLFLEDENGEFLGVNYSMVPLFIGLCILVYLLFFVYRLLYVRLSGYRLSESEIVCIRGVLVRKKSRLEYSKINAVNKRQNLIQRLFGVAVLTVDSGHTQNAKKSEITVIERAELVDRLIRELSALKDGEVPVSSFDEEPTPNAPENYYEYTPKSKLVCAALDLVCGSFFVLVAFFGLAIVCTLLLAFRLFDGFGFENRYFEYLIGALLILVGVALISFIISILLSFVSYHGFRAVRNGETLELSYGLFVRHKNSFEISKVRAVRVREGIIKRIFGYTAISLEVIGYTVDSSETHGSAEIGVLVPFCKRSEVNEILSKLLPGISVSEKSEPPCAFFPFISWFSLIFTAVSLAVFGALLSVLIGLSLGTYALKIAFCVFISAFLTVYLTVLINAILKYKNSALAIDDGRITVSDGGFVRSVSVFSKNNLVAVERVTTPMRERAGISSFILHVATNAETNEIRVNIRQSELESELLSLLK